MSRPKLLDLYCRKGGASAGYIAAGFDVIGVDKEDHSDGYPGFFVLGDAIEFAKAHGHEFDAIAASPPCQNQIAITAGNRRRPGWTDEHVNLIPPTREALDAIGKPYVIENGVTRELRRDVELCGLMFGLPVLRHRYFELGGWTAEQPEHVGPRNHRGQLTAGWRHGCVRTFEPSTCPKHGTWCKATVYGVYGSGGGKPTVEEAQRALGIDWMTEIEDLNEAIPPAYAEHIGRQLMAYLEFDYEPAGVAR